MSNCILILSLLLLSLLPYSCSSNDSNEPNGDVDLDAEMVDIDEVEQEGEGELETEVDLNEFEEANEIDLDEAANESELDPEAEPDLENEEEPIVQLLWPACDKIESEQTLAEKAAYFDKVSGERHIAGDGLLRNLYLNEDLETVEKWFHVENVILWSGMYLASQAFRYEVTRDAEAVENAKIVIDALHQLTLVAGKKGLYGRSMFNPDVSYNTVPLDSPGWSDSPARGFEGWRFRNDVSKDGYAGLMFGYSAALEHFDNPEIQEKVKARVQEIIEHITDNGLQIIDISEEVTEHGRLFHSALDDYPGFNAMLVSSWLRLGIDVMQEPWLDDFYYGCLMGLRDVRECPEIEDPTGVNVFSLTTYVDSMERWLNLFIPNCKENYDNFDMCYQAIYPLIRHEKNSELRERFLNVLKTQMFHTENPEFRSLAEIGNTMFTFVYASLVGSEPGEDFVLDNAVDLAVCMLKRFPNQKFKRHIPKGEQEVVCKSRLDNPRAADPIPIEEYDFDNYLWRLDFFEMAQKEIQEDKRYVYSPEDFLFVYWLGRLHGLLSESQRYGNQKLSR